MRQDIANTRRRNLYWRAWDGRRTLAMDEWERESWPAVWAAPSTYLLLVQTARIADLVCPSSATHVDVGLWRRITQPFEPRPLGIVVAQCCTAEFPPQNPPLSQWPTAI